VRCYGQYFPDAHHPQNSHAQAGQKQNDIVLRRFGVIANITLFFLLIFFTDVAGIPAGLAAMILLIGKVWDAVNDPIVED